MLIWMLLFLSLNAHAEYDAEITVCSGPYVYHYVYEAPEAPLGFITYQSVDFFQAWGSANTFTRYNGKPDEGKLGYGITFTAERRLDDVTQIGTLVQWNASGWDIDDTEFPSVICHTHKVREITQDDLK
jgi:hypothetical protein